MAILSEREDPLPYLQRAKRFGRPLENYIDIIPVPFVREHKRMITHSKIILGKGLLKIHPKFDKLITALRTAIEEDGVLDKESTSYHDIFDSFRLAMKYYKFP